MVKQEIRKKKTAKQLVKEFGKPSKPKLDTKPKDPEDLLHCGICGFTKFIPKSAWKTKPEWYKDDRIRDLLINEHDLQAIRRNETHQFKASRKSVLTVPQSYLTDWNK